jgi:hypothetical protein
MVTCRRLAKLAFAIFMEHLQLALRGQVLSPLTKLTLTCTLGLLAKDFLVQAKQQLLLPLVFTFTQLAQVTQV